MNNYIAYAALAIEILTAMWITANATKKTVKMWTAIPTLTAFVMFHAMWIMTADKNDVTQCIIYILATLVSIVFAIGTIISSSQCIMMKNKQLVLKPEHPITKIINWLQEASLVSEETSICGLSWSILGAMMLVPTGFIALVVLAGIQALWYWKNPGETFNRLLKLNGQKPEMKRNEYGIALSPTPYVFYITIISLLIFAFMGGKTQPANMTAIAVATLITITIGIIASTVMANKIITKINEEKNSQQQITGTHNNKEDIIQQLIELMENRPMSKPFVVWIVIALMMADKTCPVIKGH